MEWKNEKYFYISVVILGMEFDHVNQYHYTLKPTHDLNNSHG